MGVVIITTLVFGLITPPYGLSLLIASKFVGVPFSRAILRSLPLYIVFFFTIALDRKSTRLNSSHSQISYAVFCLKKKKSSHLRHVATVKARPGSPHRAP